MAVLPRAEAAALQARQQYLTTLATQRCAAPPPAVPGKRSPATQRQAARAYAPPPPPPMPTASKPEPEPLAPYKEGVH
jgi:hypothetical protein